MGSKPIVRPKALKQGSRIGLVAPAGALLDQDDVRRATEVCRALGFEPQVSPNAGQKHGYLAGTDEERLADLNGAIRDSAVDALWCLRGGYGVTRILHAVDYEALAQTPKILIGYSDITALLNAVTRITGIVTFHGPIARANLTDFSREHLERAVRHPAPAGRLGRVGCPDEVLGTGQGRIVTLQSGTAEGPLAGGNLTLLQALVGTRYFPDLHGAILFIEDVGEDLYRVDRVLAHLRSVGALDRLAGVAVGQFTEMKKATPDGALGFDEILETYFGPLGVPVAYGFPIGHVDDQWTLPLGVRARLDANAGELDLLEAAVS
ncbi:MAG: LD-carboxypeptidase [Gemmatimonadales bacterium]|nr:LD-carboxypeptidase [Gemmatimonadales bacterium]